MGKWKKFMAVALAVSMAVPSCIPQTLLAAEFSAEESMSTMPENFEDGNSNEDAVVLATLHSSKGLEFEKVFLIDVNEGITPYKKAVLQPDMEEERRLFYVGMTRAKRSLTLCSVKTLHNKKVELSRFLKEAGAESLPKE